MWNAIISTGIALVISVGSWLGIYNQQTEWDKQVQDTIKNYTIQSQKDNEVLGATLPIAGSTYTLSGSGVSSSATSFTLSSFTIPQNGYEIQDSDISDTFYMTVEPGSKTRQEIVACTTVAQNSAGTATISGCSRGMSPISPYTASTTLQFAHSGGTQVILSDPPQLFEQYFTLDNDNQTISGVVNFSVNPILTTATSSLQAINKAYADALAIAGAPDATADTKGIFEMASALETASSTGRSDGDTSAPLTPSAISFTANATTTYAIPVSRLDGKLDENWVATSTIDWDWARVGIATSSSGTELSVGGNAVIEATTTTGSLVATTTSMRIGGISYEFPGVGPASSTALTSDGSNTLFWIPVNPIGTSIMPPMALGAVATTTSNIGVNSNTTMYIGAYFIPFDIIVNKITFTANTIGSSGTLDVVVYSQDGQTKEIDVTSGTISARGVVTTAVSAVRLTQGIHYIGLIPNATANIGVNGYGSCLFDTMIDATASEPKYCGTVAVSAGTPPTTVNTVSDITSTAVAPIIRLDN